MPRQLSANEINQLLQAGVDPYGLNWDELGSKPVEYITNKAMFRGLEFYVDERVLIPRVETEALVELGVKHLSSRAQAVGRVLFADIATGSGCIGISLAKELNQLGVDFTAWLSDVSPAALAVANKNLVNLLPGVNDVELIESDLLTNYPAVKLDLIVANLPYIPSSRIAKLAEGVKDFEPRQALDGGADGLALISKLLKQAVKFLASGGIVLLEVDDTHSQADYPGWQIEVLRDENHKTRVWRCELITS